MENTQTISGKMPPAGTVLSRLAVRIVLVMAAVALLVLTGYSLVESALMEPGGSEKVWFTPDAILLQLLVLLVVLVLAVALTPLLEKIHSGTLRRCIQLLYMVAGGLFIWFGRSVPTADQGSVLGMARSWAAGDFSFLDMEYAKLYPAQLGLAGYEALIVKVFGENVFPAHVFCQLLNCLWLVLLVGMLSRIVGLVFHERRITNTFLLLLVPCLPLVFYVGFVYGEMPSMALSAAAVYCQLLYLKKGKWGWMIPAALCLAGAVLVRKNSLILVIAMVLVQLVYSIGQKRLRTLLWTLALVGTVALSQWGLTASVSALAKPYTIPEGLPYLSWISMGLQQEDGLCGAFNFRAMNLARETDFDTAVLRAEAKENIHSMGSAFVHDLGFFLFFYHHKLLQQWNEPTYGMLVMTANNTGERAPWMETLWTGSGYYVLCDIANYYQFLLYFFALAGALCLLKRAEALSLIFPLYFVGGVLFSLLWEAKSRYTLPYILFLIPLAAVGLYAICNGAWGFLGRKKQVVVADVPVAKETPIAPEMPAAPKAPEESEVPEAPKTAAQPQEPAP